MADDAVLSVGAEDNLTPVLAKMAAQTRAFGQAVGAESNKIEKAVRGVTKSINDLNTAGGGRGGKSSPLAANIAATRREMERLEDLAKQVNRLQRSDTSFSGWRMDGKGIKAGQAQEILTAADNYAKLTKQLADLEAIEARMSRADRASAFRKSQEQLFTIDPAVLNRAARDRDTLTSIYQGMWADIGDQSKLAKTDSWWPPAMLQGPRRLSEAVSQLAPTVRYAMYDVSRSTAVASAAFLAASVGAVVAAANWERAFANVERTVGGTPEQLDNVRRSLAALSQELPVTFSELSEIASVGGQMGLSAQGVVAYTEVIAKLTATTNLTADAASKALGRFKAFFSEASDPSLAVTDQTFSNLASSILRVGVNSVATETGIVNVATQISSMGSYAGFTADQVIGLSGALSSVGVPPELSRGVITRLFTQIGEAVNGGGEDLREFAELAGVSSEDFRKAWGTQEFAYIFTQMIDNLGELNSSGGQAVNTLHELGITSVRDVPVLLRLADASSATAEGMGLLTQTMNDARQGWRENLELSLQYSKINETLAARSQVLLQSIEALFATMGASAVGPVKTLVEMITNLVKGFTAMADTEFGQFMSGSAIAVAALVGGLALLVSGGARSIAALQGIHQGLEAITGSAAIATKGVRVLGIAMGTLGVAAALLAIVGTIAAIATAANEAYKPVTDLNGALESMQTDTESGSAFTQFAIGADHASKSTEAASDQADRMIDLMGGVEDKAYGAAGAVTTLGDKTRQAALNFGAASRDFLKASILNSEAFTNLTADDSLDVLRDTSFEMDRLIREVAEGGREAGAAYLEGLTGLAPNVDFMDSWNKSLRENADGTKAFTQEQLDAMHATGELLTIVESGVGQFDAAARGYALATSAAEQYGSALELTEGEIDAFAVANQEAVNSMAEGFKKFVDTGSLIGFAQAMEAAFATIDDGATELDEHAEAIAGFEKSWEDAYGGAAFSIDSYMTVFRRAAEEQQTFIANLQTLMARGLDPAIIGDLAEMGPQAAALVQALVDGTAQQLQEYEDLYAQTGFDAMVGMAAGQLAAQNIVLNAAKHLSNAELKQLSADLAAGTPLTDAMRKWNLDAEGNPMKAPAEAYLRDGWRWRFQNEFNQGVSLPVTPYLTQTKAAVSTIGGGTGAMFYLHRAQGGYVSGPGTGTSDSIPAKLSNGEFVMTAAATRAIGVSNLYALMRSAQSGRAARPSGGGGYAAGGLVQPRSASIQVVELSATDRALLAAAGNVTLTVDGQVVARATNTANFVSAKRGSN